MLQPHKPLHFCHQFYLPTFFLFKSDFIDFRIKRFISAIDCFLLLVKISHLIQSY